MAIDPYETWLGIPAHRRPPTHYDLLGLVPFESDPQTIDQAALRRMGKVRQHQIGPQSDLSQEILAELARARLILMDPERRANYDAKLRARGESGLTISSPQNDGNGDNPKRPPGPGNTVRAVFGQLDFGEEQGIVSSSPVPSSTKAALPRNKRRFIGASAAGFALIFGALSVYFASRPASRPRSPEPDHRGHSLASPVPKVVQDRREPPAVKRPAHKEAPLPPSVADGAADRGRAGVVQPKPADPPDRRRLATTAPQDALPEGGTPEPNEPYSQRLAVEPPSIQPDPIAQGLAKARKACEDKLTKLQGPLLKALDKAERDPRKNKNPILLMLIKEEKRLFDANGQIPSSIETSDYQAKALKARRELWRELEKARITYTKSGKNDVARKIDIEQEKLERAMAATKPPLMLKDDLLIATGDSDQPATWLYTLVRPGPDWLSFRYKPVGWAQGQSGFGTASPPSAVRLGTVYDGDSIWLRTLVDYPIPLADDVLMLKLFHDCREAIVYVNGERLWETHGWGRPYYEVRIEGPKAKLFHPGRNILSVYCNDKDGQPTGIDIGLYLRR
jgi:curved DNA-binding protein CbpA